MLGIFGNRSPNKETVEGIISDAGLTPTHIQFKDGELTVLLDGSAATREAMQTAESALKKLRGIKKVRLIPTIDRPAGSAPTPLPKKTASVIDTGVPLVIAVASGKGGVGKSTVAANLAAALHRSGLRVGLLDADIYGPSVPRLFGVAAQKPVQNGDKLTPIESQGIRLMSMGFMVPEDAPMIWRGPMVQSALRQMLAEVDWSGCDVLLLDLPPGTGDAQLTLAQGVKLDGAVIVSTPQDIALIDARKGLEMFRKTHVPILGVIENMSYYCCPSCGHQDAIFGTGGARDEAARLGVPFLGAIPLNGAIRHFSDAGTPITLAEPNGAVARTYMEIASTVREAAQQAQKPAPKITFA